MATFFYFRVLRLCCSFWSDLLPLQLDHQRHRLQLPVTCYVSKEENVTLRTLKKKKEGERNYTSSVSAVSHRLSSSHFCFVLSVSAAFCFDSRLSPYSLHFNSVSFSAIITVNLHIIITVNQCLRIAGRGLIYANIRPDCTRDNLPNH